MKIGLAIYDHPPSHVLAIGQRADVLGFNTMWLGEHVVAPSAYSSAHPYEPAGKEPRPIVSPDTNLADPFVLASAILATTQHLRVATGVYILPLRHPLLTARASETIHQISEGRFVLGVGSGWLEEEFESLEVPFKGRGKRLDEAIEVARAAWNGGEFEHRGDDYDFGPLIISRESVDIPIIIGGTTERALARAASLGDGWYSPPNTLDDCIRLRDRIEQLRHRYGTSDRPFTYFVRAKRLTSLGDLEAFRDAGFEHVVASGYQLWPRRTPLALGEKLKALDRLASILIA